MENALTLDDYVAIAKRRFWQMAIVFVVVLTLSALVINSLPPRYRSTAVVSVESQQIPEGLVQSTVSGYAAERIGFVKQRVMTSVRLLDLIDRFDLFPELRDSTPASVLVDKLRKRIVLETIRDPSITRRGRSSTVAFTLAFEHGDPETAAAVANNLVTMFLEENVRTRTARATETTQFITREAARLSTRVGAMDAKVAEYKQKHGDALPEHLSMLIGMLESAETDLRAIEQEARALEEQRRFLETQQASLGAILGASSNQPALSPAQQLAALRTELVEKSSVYGSVHPDLRSLKHRIAGLEREVKASGAGPQEGSSGGTSDLAGIQIEAQIVSANAQLRTMQTQKEELQGKIENLRVRIMKAPQVERELKDLTREYESAMTEFEEIKAKQSDAELSENLEKQEKAERFALLESPQIPSMPVWPEKKKAYFLALALALLSSAGTAYIPEVLDKSIRGQVMLTSLLKRPPLAVIPFITSSEEKRRMRRRRLWVLLSFCCFLIAALAMAHFFFMPLDVLVELLIDAVAHR